MSSQPDNKWRRPRRILGLGDAVAIVAQPVARVIDAFAGTSIRTCQSCQKRRESWNEKFPLP